jgi:polysaccharide biosynthesis/export protein
MLTRGKQACGGPPAAVRALGEAVLAAVWLLSSVCSPAAAAGDPVFEVVVPSSQEQFTAAEAMARFEAPADGPYRLGPGDELALDVWDHPELSGQHVIGPDGIITVPVAGDIRLAELDREQARTALGNSLASYYPDVIISLRVDSYRSNSVYVLGRVVHPGLVYFESTPTVLEAITRAGGLPLGETGSGTAPMTRCAVLRGRERAVWIDLGALLNGNMSLNLRLYPGDVVYIPDAADRLVYVLGEVVSPGPIMITPEMTLLEALARAGGPTVDAATGSMQLIRPDLGERARVSLGDLTMAQRERNFLMIENDVLFVPRRGIARVDYWISKLNPFATLLLLGTAASK